MINLMMLLRMVYIKMFLLLLLVLYVIGGFFDLCDEIVSYIVVEWDKGYDNE